MNAVEKRMRSLPGEYPRDPLAVFLRGLSSLYSMAVRARAVLYRREVFKSARLPCAVVSVGNLTVGGTGKTPMAILVARTLQSMGLSVGLASRGYRGSMEGACALVSDGEKLLLTAEQSGDEPSLMARKLPGVPVAVGRRRAESGRLLIDRFGIDVLVLDDGFQHLALQRDLDLVLADAACPFGNGFLLPRGVLREPPAALSRAGALVLTRFGASSRVSSEAVALMGRKPLFTSSHAPEGVYRQDRYTAPLTGAMGSGYPPGFLEGRRVVAFSGIAQNLGFFGGLRELGADTAACLGFGDHHAFGPADKQKILDAAAETGARCLVTTEKDMVRLLDWDTGALDLLALSIRLAVRQEEAFTGFLESLAAKAIG